MLATWDTLINWAIGQGIGESSQERYAICYDNPVLTPIEKCRYEVAIVIDPGLPVPAPFARSEIPGGTYAVLYFRGQPEETAAAQLSLYTGWLPNSGFEPDEFPLVELYLTHVRDDGFIEMEICVKLRQLF